MRVAFLVGAVVAGLVGLSGCSQPASGSEPALGALDELQATPDTGVLWGVVVDAAIVPIAGVHVNVTAGPSAVTDEEGRFGFDDLAPGFYSVAFAATGYYGLALQILVEAGTRPPLRTIQLEDQPMLEPYIEEATFSGYLACSVTVTLDFSACSFPTFIFEAVGVHPLEDRQIFFFEVGAQASWVQLEMRWDSTQALGSHMAIGLDTTAKDGSGWWGVNGTRGPSPLTTAANTSRSTEAGYGVTHDVMMRIFSSDLPESRLPDPCVSQPLLGYCFLGVGATVQQRAELYLTVFHNQVPPAGWTFVADGPL